jgi:hypothetical protein
VLEKKGWPSCAFSHHLTVHLLMEASAVESTHLSLESVVSKNICINDIQPLELVSHRPHFALGTPEPERASKVLATHPVQHELHVCCIFLFECSRLVSTKVEATRECEIGELIPSTTSGLALIILSQLLLSVLHLHRDGLTKR